MSGKKPVTDQFEGFASGRVRMTSLPEPFFSELLPLVDDLAELKVLLFCFWALLQREGDYRYLRRADFLADPSLMRGLAVTDPDMAPEAILDRALERAIARRALLTAAIAIDGESETLYFANTHMGRIAAEQATSGQYIPGEDGSAPVDILPPRPSIYRLYEDNIGPLTPMIGEELKSMETDYSPDWLEEALRLAVEANKRSLRYIRAILERWRSEGKQGELAGRNTPSDGTKYVTGKYAGFIEH
jgi:DnaD/phage-associated family protein